jgi:septum formation protein
MTAQAPLSRVVLASLSPRRLELLASLGLDVQVAASGYAEPPIPDLSPPELARAHALAKLQAVAGADLAPVANRQNLVVAADTVVDLDGRALGKPRDAAQAELMLTHLSGREHLVHTAIAMALPGNGQAVEELQSTRVRFFPLTAQEIADYIATGEPFDKAGGYGIQGRAAAMVESIDGDFYTVMGFPLARFIRTLRRLGFTLPVSNPHH